MLLCVRERASKRHRDTEREIRTQDHILSPKRNKSSRLSQEPGCDHTANHSQTTFVHPSPRRATMSNNSLRCSVATWGCLHKMVHSHPWPLCQSAGGRSVTLRQGLIILARSRRHLERMYNKTDVRCAHILQKARCDSIVQQKQFSHCVCGVLFKKRFYIVVPPPPYFNRNNSR